MALIRFFPAALIAGLIFFLSSRPHLPSPPVAFEGLDKILHAGIYGLLALALLFADRWPSGSRAWRWAAVVLAYGLSDELHQSFVPDRQADPLDLLADGGGAMLAVGVCLRLTPRR
jgi:VanZ family protein